MKEIELMLTGQMEMSEFVELLRENDEIQNTIKNIIPPEVANNKENDLWKKLSFETLEKYNFDLLALLTKMFRFDGTISDNLNIFGIIARTYCFFNPEIVCTQKYSDRFGLYLDVVRDCFDGPEVQHVVEEIILDALTITGKRKSLIYAKQKISEKFLTKNNKRPRWVQGPEWPMGTLSPMRFISQKHRGEVVEYQFEDVDTSTSRIVQQYY